MGGTLEFAQFIEWVFYGVVSGGVIIAVKILGDMTDSINQLNIKMAILIEKTSNHETELMKSHEVATDFNKRLLVIESLIKQ